MIAEVVVTAYSPIALSDVLGLEATASEAQFTRVSASNGDIVTIRCSGSVWDRIRPQLRRLSLRRVPALAAGVAVPGKTAPALTYTMTWIPDGRPRLDSVSGSASVGSGATLTVVGNRFLGIASKLDIFRSRVQAVNYGAAGQWTNPSYINPELLMTITAVAKGPVGDRIGFYIAPESGSGSVSVEEYADGQVLITVVPAAGASTTTAIASQISGSTLASVWITASAVVASAKITPFSNGDMNPQGIAGPSITGSPRPFRYLVGGDGSGIAFMDAILSGTDPTNRSRIAAQVAGNQGNNISITLLSGQAGNSVTTTGTDIVVSRIATTTSLATFATAINTDATASALVKVTSVGTGNLTSFTKTYLYGGSGETPVATLGGAATAITAMSDTGMTITATGAALSGAGVSSGMVAELVLLIDYQRLEASLVAAT